MKRICTKCIVAALILSMGITAGIPAYAAQPQTTAATEQAAQLSLEETASQYFENYPSDKHVVSAEQLLNRVEEGESFCLLDIRSAEDYAKGHIQGAVNIPYGADVADALEIIPNDQPVLVYCYSGQTGFPDRCSASSGWEGCLQCQRRFHRNFQAGKGKTADRKNRDSFAGRKLSGRPAAQAGNLRVL